MCIRDSSAAIAEARDKGDLSENAEYDAAKEAQGMLEMRINKLKAKMCIRDSAYTVRYFSPENSTNWTKPENLFITALITGKFYRDICLPTPVFGIPSGVFSHY